MTARGKDAVSFKNLFSYSGESAIIKTYYFQTAQYPKADQYRFLNSNDLYGP